MIYCSSACKCKCTNLPCDLQGEINDEEFREYFSQYGEIEDSVVRTASRLIRLLLVAHLPRYPTCLRPSSDVVLFYRAGAQKT
jgi:RNA recognition motif-containing protein